MVELGQHGTVTQLRDTNVGCRPDPPPAHTMATLPEEILSHRCVCHGFIGQKEALIVERQGEGGRQRKEYNVCVCVERKKEGDIKGRNKETE